MKKLFLFLLCFQTAIRGEAQWLGKFQYVWAGPHLGYDLADHAYPSSAPSAWNRGVMYVGFSTGAFFAKGYTLSFGIDYARPWAKNLPADFDAGSGTGNGTPADGYLYFRPAFGKFFPLTKYNSLRLYLDGSVSLLRRSTALFTPQNAMLFGSNYAVDQVHDFTPGLALKVLLDISPIPSLGMAIGLFGDLNKYRPIYGFQMTTQFRLWRR